MPASAATRFMVRRAHSRRARDSGSSRVRSPRAASGLHRGPQARLALRRPDRSHAPHSAESRALCRQPGRASGPGACLAGRGSEAILIAVMPLAGLTVLDLTQNVAGPYCTQILGRSGADVVKVERPGRGDETRAWAPPSGARCRALFLSFNRNKRSLALDVKRRGRGR